MDEFINKTLSDNDNPFSEMSYSECTVQSLLPTAIQAAKESSDTDGEMRSSFCDCSFIKIINGHLEKTPCVNIPNGQCQRLHRFSATPSSHSSDFKRKRTSEDFSFCSASYVECPGHENVTTDIEDSTTCEILDDVTLPVLQPDKHSNDPKKRKFCSEESLLNVKQPPLQLKRRASWSSQNPSILKHGLDKSIKSSHGSSILDGLNLSVFDEPFDETLKSSHKATFDSKGKDCNRLINKTRVSLHKSFFTDTHLGNGCINAKEWKPCSVIKGISKVTSPLSSSTPKRTNNHKVTDLTNKSFSLSSPKTISEEHLWLSADLFNNCDE
ncbi:unnamed protein product [Clavelina lepadiformis]|uniref:Uncharacterized protein n=1 Tax=Clavelina lepadiformis TaxID=159417 RepID=A0ABP0G0F3_CLALP